MTLFDLKEGESGFIVKIKGRGQFRQRIMEMGFISGKEVTVVKKAPLRDPVEYNVMGYNVSLRNSEARLIEITGEHPAHNHNSFSTIEEEAEVLPVWLSKKKNIHVALVGNPNSGKTTLFNYASGSKERVGNYSGVTVDAKEAVYKQSGYKFDIVDLPGTYSIKSYSPEELYVRNYIFNSLPDVIVNIVDASNLERNLYLTTQLIDMGVIVIIALNMYDELENKGDKLDYQMLGKMLGVPIVPTVSSKGKGIKELFDKIIDVYEGNESTLRHIHINYGNSIEQSIEAIQNKIKIEENRDFTNIFSARYLAIGLLEKDTEYTKEISRCVNPDEIIRTGNIEREKLEKQFAGQVESVITDTRYGFISGALKETLKASPTEKKRNSEVIDNFLTHKLWGIPLFVLFLWIMFYSTFNLGGYMKHWIESFVALTSDFFISILPHGMFKDLLVDGIIAGVGGVIVFIPNIVILFLFISLMEDTGYMARAVFIMDRAMHKIGLHGKSFIPLLMGFGCNVPAILATRIIESKRDRLVTMLINPFMSCSARLPVYIIFISAFFKSHEVTALLIIYAIGVFLAMTSALIFKRTLFKKTDLPFVMELPPYRIPTLRSITKHMWFRTELYLKKIGSVILIASVIIWFLSYFPHHTNYSKNYQHEISGIERTYTAQLGSNTLLNSKYNDSLILEKQKKTNLLLLEQQSEQQAHSFIGMIGRFIEPVMKPLGFDWKMTVSLISGLAAKEVVVSTLCVLYQAENNNNASGSLVNKIQTQVYTTGEKAGSPIFTPLVAACFMLFILIYFPCIGVIAAIRRESKSWKWALFTVVYTTSLAWIIAFAVYNIGSLFL